MKPSDRRAQLKQDMASRTQESYNSKDDSGRFKSIFIKDKIGNVQTWKCTEDEHFINVIPFVAGEHHPTVKPGNGAYMLDIHVHRKVGINEDSYICMARTYGKPCPICEHQAEQRKLEEYNEDYVKSLNPTRRVIYNIECLDNDKEAGKGIQLFEVSHWLFEKKVAELAKKPRGGGFILFADPDEGKSIFFRKKGNTATNTEFSAFKFEDRDEPIPDELLDKALVLDEIIHIPTYNEVKNAFFGSEVDEGVPSKELEEKRGEAEASQQAAGRARRPSSSEPEPQPEPDASPAADGGEFECPGEPVKDFNQFDVCKDCPDFGECKEEWEKEEAARKAEEEEEKKKQEPAPTGLAARRLRSQAAPEEKKEEPASEPASEPAPSEETGRRVRRRPGQE